MHSTSRQTPNIYFIITGILILIEIILLTSAVSFGTLAFILLDSALILLVLFHALFFYIEADTVLPDSIFHARLLPGRLARSSSLLTIQGGEVDQEYFLLQAKPRSASLFIHPDSAAVLVNSRGDYRSLDSGFHALHTGERIAASFDLSLQSLTCGPLAGENPFASRRSGENYTSFHARQLRAQQVRSLSADQQELYPSFTIDYCLRTVDPADEPYLTALTRFLFPAEQAGPVVPALNAVLCSQISAYWTMRVRKASLSAILSDVGGNGLAGILQEINAQLNTAAAGKQRILNSPLRDIARLRIPLLRVTLDKVWYQDMTQSAQNLSDEAR
ncbi:MAG: hypothetical protein PWQ55_273 [Chloroflexota bacterium]|nr:hypothetical protein [Chloroflexota bacterium]